MVVSIIICALTCILMILSVLFLPKIKLGKISLDAYWVVTLLGVVALIIAGQTDLPYVGKQLIANTPINPLKILTLFICMTVLSIFLDELGFFSYLASITLHKAKAGQKKLFIYLYLIVSILTVFTSNDVIILSFTPFICYFSKSAKISPTPYLVAEFVAANTWSMALIIGNPTNVYLATAYGVDFLGYIKVMLLPTVVAGSVAFFMLYLLFYKKLSTPILEDSEIVEIKDKPMLTIGLSHLLICTVLLAIGSYINLEMWLVSLLAVVSLFVFVLVVSVARGQKPKALRGCLKRAPWQLIPFILSMFVMIVTLSSKGVTGEIANVLSGGSTLFKYGVSSFLAANVINNIPMSVLFSSVIDSAVTTNSLHAVFATVVGSNVGAFLTPIGALAGIMWSSIVGGHGVKFGYLNFLKMGLAVALPALISALAILALVL